jgi:hemoglobin
MISRSLFLAIMAAGACASLGLPAAAGTTLFADLGGSSGIDRIVDEAVSLWLSDDRVKLDFDNINPDRLRSRLKSQLCQLADGPCEYKGRTMEASHKGLAVTQAKFNAVAEDLQTAMERAGVGYWTQNRLMARLAPMHRLIVTQ